MAVNGVGLVLAMWTTFTFMASFDLFRLSFVTAYYTDSYTHVINIDQYGSTTVIQSPKFPRPYLLSVQPITWLVRSGAKGGSFQVSFSDLHLHPFSRLEVYDGDKLNFELSTSTHLLKRYTNGADYFDRLPLMTRNSALTIVFIPSYTTQIHPSHFEGFRLEARLVHFPPSAWREQPFTQCHWLPYTRDEVVVANTGWKSTHFDCVWVLRPLVGSRAYVRLVGQKVTAGGVEFDFKVHKGVSSQSKLIGHLKPMRTRTYESFTSDVGLYIRFNGTLVDHNFFAIQYFIFKPAMPGKSSSFSGGLQPTYCRKDPLFNFPCSADPKINDMCIVGASTCDKGKSRDAKCQSPNCSVVAFPKHSCFRDGHPLTLCPNSECVLQKEICKVSQHSKIICADTDPSHCHLVPTDSVPADPHYIGRLNSIVACTTSLLLIGIFGILLIRTRRKRSQRQQAQRDAIARRSSLLREHLSRSETMMSTLLTPVIGQLASTTVPLYRPSTPPPSYSEVMGQPAYTPKAEEQVTLCRESRIEAIEEETAETLPEIAPQYASVLLPHQIPSPYREEIV